MYMMSMHYFLSRHSLCMQVCICVHRKRTIFVCVCFAGRAGEGRGDSVQLLRVYAGHTDLPLAHGERHRRAIIPHERHGECFQGRLVQGHSPFFILCMYIAHHCIVYIYITGDSYSSYIRKCVVNILPYVCMYV